MKRKFVGRLLPNIMQLVSQDLNQKQNKMGVLSVDDIKKITSKPKRIVNIICPYIQGNDEISNPNNPDDIGYSSIIKAGTYVFTDTNNDSIFERDENYNLTNGTIDQMIKKMNVIKTFNISEDIDIPFHIDEYGSWTANNSISPIRIYRDDIIDYLGKEINMFYFDTSGEYGYVVVNNLITVDDPIDEYIGMVDYSRAHIATGIFDEWGNEDLISVSIESFMIIE